jgi:hypothetical protein
MLSQRTFKQTPDLTTRDEVQISRLINSIFYFIAIVYILKKDDHFRLIAIHNRRLLTDRTYPTERGAKIAFSKLFRGKAWKEDVKAEWTDFYPPDRFWLDKNMKIVEKAH